MIEGFCSMARSSDAFQRLIRYATDVFMCLLCVCC